MRHAPLFPKEDILYTVYAAVLGIQVCVCVCRFGPSTPVAVESTANLVRCQILDRRGTLERDDLVLLYGMALTRCVCVSINDTDVI